MQQLTEAQRFWVAALRSGVYVQAKYKLQQGVGYCCLGVACKVAEQHGINVNRVEGVIDGLTLTAQPDVLDWLGLYSHNGEFKDDEECVLSNLNDEHEYTFEELADFIEQNAEKLFK